MKDSISKRIEDFFLVGTKCRNHDRQKEYDEEMRPYREKHKDKKDKKTYASLDWLIHVGAISEADIKKYDEVRSFRNELAHEMLNLMSVNTAENLEKMNQHFITMLELLRKIETYWILNVDILCNPEYDGKDISAQDVFPGPLLAMEMLWGGGFCAENILKYLLFF
ncbi:hypothetical protein [Fibrobacter sp. UWT2]|uniref:hypothetical protein n=1 Tax=Fibrobacter sp. UWT2 TaxID=1896224 RepID=UPI0015B433EF|nr:hypothetical protein [Fibrobacter sp. UWT2]